MLPPQSDLPSGKNAQAGGIVSPLDLPVNTLGSVYGPCGGLDTGFH